MALVAQLLLVVGGPAGIAAASPGDLDGTFGSGNGQVVAAGAEPGTGVAVLPNGDIAVSQATSSSSVFEVSLYSSAGSLLWTKQPVDSGNSPLGNGGAALSVAATPAGNIVAAGFFSNCGDGEQPALAEFRPDGSTAFSATINCTGTGGGTFSGVASDSSGNIVAAGTVLISGNPQMVVDRVTSAGTTGAPVVSAFSGGAEPTGAAGDAVTLASNGDALVAGDVVESGAQTPAVVAFSAAGIDATFGSSGIATAAGPGAFHGVAVTSSGLIAAVGVDGSQGVLDGFKSDGSATGTPLLTPATSALNAVTYQPQGNTLTAVGSSGTGSSQQMLLVQFNGTDLTVNTGFAPPNGAETGSFATAGQAALFGVASQPDGKVVGAGLAPADSLGLIRAFGPALYVQTPPMVQLPAPGQITVDFQVSIDEPVFSSVEASFCAPGASINGSTCNVIAVAEGATSITVPVTINVTGPPGSEQFQTLNAQAANGLAPSLSAPDATVTILLGQPTQYRLAGSDGGVFNFGGAPFYGSTGDVRLNAPIVGIADDTWTNGYWLVGSDGGIFNFNAPFYGSTGDVHLNQPIVGMAEDPATGGYWLVAADGGVFPFNAPFLGSTGSVRLNEPIVGIAASPSGNGYWLVASDGGVFPFGDARFYGSTGAVHLNQPVVGMAADPQTGGYWLVASDGGIFNFNAPYLGSTGAVRLNQPIVGMQATPGGSGYWLVARDGGIFNFNAPFLGSTGSVRLNAPIVGMSG